MDIRAIIFDKDGTLLAFDDFWVTVSDYVIKDILSQLHREDIPSEKLLEAIGVKSGKTAADGLLCKGTYAQIGLALHGVLQRYGAELPQSEAIGMTEAAYTRNACFGTVRPTCENIRGVLENLKNGGRRLFVVTTDNPEITDKCLASLGIKDLFDGVFTDDGNMPVKPNPQCARAISEAFGIPPEKMMMVGDTVTDIKFARNAGIPVILVGNTSESSAPADAYLPDISYISELIGEGCAQ